MNRNEFEALRALEAKKQIVGDIEFHAERSLTPILTFGDVVVSNEMGLDLVLNGRYNPLIPSFTYNFVVRGTGPICRIDVNGTKHGDAGRTHKHELKTEACPRLNLPFANPRSELSTRTPRDVWFQVCAEAHIVHSGHFVDPI